MKYKRGYDLYNIELNFWAQVEQRSSNDCWPWLGRVNLGYGIFYFPGVGLQKACNVAYYFTTPVILVNHEVIRHTCSNKICCNPKHLVGGTSDDNVRDRVEREQSWRNWYDSRSTREE